MRLVRMILALVISLSLATLPARGSAMSVIESATQDPVEVASAKLAMPDEMSSVMECSLDDTKARLCDQCPLAVCAAQFINIACFASFSFDFLVMAGSPLPIPVDQVVTLHSGSPPFRPPRV